MKIGDLIMCPEGFDYDLCIILDLDPKTHRACVFNTKENRKESYRIEWVMNSCELIR